MGATFTKLTPTVHLDMIYWCHMVVCILDLQFTLQWPRHQMAIAVPNTIISSCPPPFAKAGDIKTHLSVRLSVTKAWTWLISSEVLIEHWYLACMILVTSPFNLHHAMTLTLTYFKVKVVAGRGTTIFQICLLWTVLRLLALCLSKADLFFYAFVRSLYSIYTLFSSLRVIVASLRSHVKR